jgi:dimethylsulfone monooxygenase
MRADTDRPLKSCNHFRLGLFGSNCSSGLAITQVPERWKPTWANNLMLARMADEAGIDFMLPIARWRGFGGATDFEGESLETITWAGGLLAHTKNLTVFGTVHAPLVHPVFAAKQFATIDHVSAGRFGLNIVCGWNQDEFEMFGTDLRQHDDRYAHGQEWWDIVQKIWSSKSPFDFAGKYFSLSGVIGDPKPYGKGRPVLMNAGASKAGRSFGIRNCDFLFTVVLDVEQGRKIVAEVSTAAKQAGREVGVITTCYVVCRPTRKEANDYHRWYVEENADWEAVDRLTAMQRDQTQGRPPEVQSQFRSRFAGGLGCYPLIGTPDDIAAELVRFNQVGFSGSTIAFVDYVAELPYFAAEVLPRLERLGLRRPHGSVTADRAMAGVST